MRWQHCIRRNSNRRRCCPCCVSPNHCCCGCLRATPGTLTAVAIVTACKQVAPFVRYHRCFTMYEILFLVSGFPVPLSRGSPSTCLSSQIESAEIEQTKRSCRPSGASADQKLETRTLKSRIRGLPDSKGTLRSSRNHPDAGQTVRQYRLQR